jgi:ribonuclease D
MSTDTWVVKSDLPDELYQRFCRSPELAWDIETSGLDFQNDKIGTVQLHNPNVGSVLVQIEGVTPPSLCRLLSDQRVRKVFHHAPFDLRFMLAQWTCWPQNVACTKIASRLLDPHADSAEHSLKPLLLRHRGIEIDKSQQTSDWIATELSDEQLQYAFNDVVYLLDLHSTLTKALEDVGLIDIYRRCLDFLPTRVGLDVGGWPDVFLY